MMKSNSKHLISCTRVAVFAAIALAAFASATAADWGTLKGRFVLDGDPGEPDKLNVNKDVEYCGKNNLVDESITVGEGNALENVFVYLYLKRGKSVDIHPDLAEPSSEPVVLDNHGCRFEPHVALLRTGQTLEVKNSDEGVGHNTNFTLLKNPAFNEMVTNSSPIKKTFMKPESYPSSAVCSIHPWMSAFVLIRDNPYMATSGEDGSFVIEKIPAGTHEFIFWQESCGNLKNLAVGKSKTSRKGRAKLKIPAGGELDLGVIKVKLSDLRK